jgi:hypothetical protein
MVPVPLLQFCGILTWVLSFPWDTFPVFKSAFLIVLSVIQLSVSCIPVDFHDSEYFQSRDNWNITWLYKVISKKVLTTSFTAPLPYSISIHSCNPTFLLRSQLPFLITADEAFGSWHLLVRSIAVRPEIVWKSFFCVCLCPRNWIESGSMTAANAPLLSQVTTTA